LKIRPLDGSPEARKTADLANEWVKRASEIIRSQHPANMVTLRGWSTEPGLPKFEDVFKMKAAAMAVYPMYKGLASLVGMTLIEGLRNLEDQLEALRRNWDAFDFFFCSS